mmetsp:Transcript_28205/g.68625  ORF Transcript_28205/g.68625 Transcript_28205/m.68625 type:complete len:361 (+) Transcript_28205:2802-3884(+)
MTKRRQIFHLPTPLPYQFKRSKIPPNSIVHFGDHRGLISRELGRGMNGIVLLIEVQSDRDVQTVALKVQTAPASLAWEFEILKRLENRLHRRRRKNDSPNFPLPLSFVCCHDGAFMSLSPASRSGFHLLDLSNFYRTKLRQEVPELIALHYLVWMMRILDELHRDGRILHCDVKPDNFVLSCSATRTPQDPTSESLCRLHGLTLVDFGRAVDMAEISEDSTNECDEQNIALLGTATTAEMCCVSMRRNRPWSYDADYFGLLSSVHVLLFGNHLTIMQDHDGKWKPKTKLKRYWNSGIWNEVFDSMLNCPLSTAYDTSSRMRKLRLRIEAYLDREVRNVNHLLNRQVSLLPDSRDKISPLV